jgi:hypothetical protein
VNDTIERASALNCDKINLLSLPSETEASKKENKCIEYLKAKYEVSIIKK